VTNGDLIVLYPVGGERPRLPRLPQRLQRLPRSLSASAVGPSDGICLEMLRLADAAYMPLEVSQVGGLAYRQLWEDEVGVDEEDGDDDVVKDATVVSGPTLSTEALPVLWQNKGRPVGRRTQKGENGRM
jgi:hypothetical protein